MKLLFVHAHYDDYEFTTAGTFELFRRALGDRLQARVLVCTDGAAGHHFRTREQTAALRWREQQASACVGQYECEVLRLPDGTQPREACLQISIPLLAALWKSIRDFQPDYLICPPYVTDPKAGLHNDHQTIAEAVRRVAYMINVPHAFTPEYPADETRSTQVRTPVILNTYDGYQRGSNSFDLAVNIGPVFDEVVAMTWCHQSQIREWLPWVGRHEMAVPSDVKEWGVSLRQRFLKRNRELEVDSEDPHEFFTVTTWGEQPDVARMKSDWSMADTQWTRWDAMEALNR